ncbi:MAG: choice-of-anchor L domain-containing protein [Chloroflexota bacterium]
MKTVRKLPLVLVALSCTAFLSMGLLMSVNKLVVADSLSSIHDYKQTKPFVHGQPSIPLQEQGGSILENCDHLNTMARQVIDAIDVPCIYVRDAQLKGVLSDTFIVSHTMPIIGFPRNGNTFGVLSTICNINEVLFNGLPNDISCRKDIVRLHLRLEPPEEAECVSIDFSFYSEEYPKFVGSRYNDTFTAQLNTSEITTRTITSGTKEIVEVIADGNFAIDLQEKAISVNTIFNIEPLSLTSASQGGLTPLLRARAKGPFSDTIDLYFSIQNLGDTINDSAVFLDNFFFSKNSNCEPGAAADTDRDGFLDEWERDGLTVTIRNVTTYLDLPRLGADPMHKDIFVEIDYMSPFTNSEHTYKPTHPAISKIVEAFASAPITNPDGTTGIHLHVDYGPDAPLTLGKKQINERGQVWGEFSDSDALPWQKYVSTCIGSSTDPTFEWNDIDVIKKVYQSEERAAVFHYSLWVHELCDLVKEGTSGISRNLEDEGNAAEFYRGASDFIVSLGATRWIGRPDFINVQAGTFMHELGHNLGLRHGGTDDINYKPNYLSVMNYSFQTRGLIIDGKESFDYSRHNLLSLDENQLDESIGIYEADSISGTLGTRYHCPTLEITRTTNAQHVDWNCNGDDTENDIRANINGNDDGFNAINDEVLHSGNDWQNIRFSDGLIGKEGAIIPLPLTTKVNELTASEDARIPPIWLCRADLSENQWVVTSDLPLLDSKLGACKGCREDFDGNGLVDQDDVKFWTAAWGPCSP